MCFTNLDHLASLSGKTYQETKVFIEELLVDNEVEWRKKFRDKRKDHIRKLYPDGGSPSTDDLCPNNKKLKNEHVVGKLLIKKIRETSEEKLGIKINPTKESGQDSIAPELKNLINLALKD